MIRQEGPKQSNTAFLVANPQTPVTNNQRWDTPTGRPTDPFSYPLGSNTGIIASIVSWALNASFTSSRG